MDLDHIVIPYWTYVRLNVDRDSILPYLWSNAAKYEMTFLNCHVIIYSSSSTIFIQTKIFLKSEKHKNHLSNIEKDWFLPRFDFIQILFWFDNAFFKELEIHLLLFYLATNAVFNYFGKAGFVTLPFDLVTSCYGQTTVCWRPAFCWLRWGSMNIVTKHKGNYLGRGIQNSKSLPKGFFGKK